MRKPLGWRYHKMLCDIGWFFRYTYPFGWRMYYSHLDVMVKKYKLNYYGQKA